MRTEEDLRQAFAALLCTFLPHFDFLSLVFLLPFERTNFLLLLLKAHLLFTFFLALRVVSS
jgi:hypothetical protein